MKPSKSSKTRRHTKLRRTRKNNTKTREQAEQDQSVEPIQTIRARELQEKQFPDLRFAAQDIVPEGLTLLAGKPKTGKSWFVLNLASDIANGSKAFGSVDSLQGPVLYCALEDNQRRLQRRLQTLLGDCTNWPSELHLTTAANRLDEGLVEDLASWIKRYEPILVIIDTLAKVRSVGSRDGYDVDYASLTPLQELAGETRVAIVLVHHLRKMAGDDPFDTISGTTGLTGAVDAALVLQRGNKGTTLYGRGREIEEFEKAIQFSGGRWRILGNAEEVQRSDERKSILNVLSHKTKPIGPSEIAKALDKDVGSIRQLLFKMHRDAEVLKFGRGKYSANPGV